MVLQLFSNPCVQLFHELLTKGNIFLLHLSVPVEDYACKLQFSKYFECVCYKKKTEVQS
jgi:hypothetical protein